METITPEIAKTMLGENVNNRCISRDNVNLFAREIRNGEWRFNGEAIKFGKDGRLLDGQHRLLAVIAADKPLTTLVIRGLEDETQQTMDSGKTRTLGDVLTLRGEKNSTQLASLARDNRVRIAALTIKAWNKWRKGKPLRQLKFSAGESFPTPL